MFSPGKLPLELIYLLIKEFDVPELLILGAASNSLRNAVLHNKRIGTLRGCYRFCIAPSISESPCKNPFSGLSELELNLDLNAHRYALYTIKPFLDQLPLSRLRVRGIMDPVAGVKLRELITDPNFNCQQVEFIRATFNDEDSIDGRLVIYSISSFFNGKSSVSFSLCTFDSGSLLALIEMVGAGQLKNFFFRSNFIDEFPTQALRYAIESNPVLSHLEISGAGLGFEADPLALLFKTISASGITHLTLRTNDIGLVQVSLPPFPQVVFLDLSDNPLFRLNPTDFEAWKRTLTSVETLKLEDTLAI
ncbi:hypothetical protein DSO57_1018415 [Entomophthora muscae]|uniref:Uncharacterized protein n=1 Tax=Entomophthora muscae TaxID=34485 RepID=A0ACC2TEZ8_9FUNG|nr:hypothetical protein DSO57_1018415 [Entomophthora muscae]